jgi:hypothetical protein
VNGPTEPAEEVVGIDNLNAYYDPTLKEARLARLTPRAGFRFEKWRGIAIIIPCRRG